MMITICVSIYAFVATVLYVSFWQVGRRFERKFTDSEWNADHLRRVVESKNHERDSTSLSLTMAEATITNLTLRLDAAERERDVLREKLHQIEENL